MELTTDVGLKGIGGASRYNGPAEMKEYAEAVVKPAILGKNPFDVEYLAAGLCGPRARGLWAGVDTAMWDIIGKAKGLPLYRILATDTEPVTHIRMYASGGEFTWQKGPALWDRTTWSSRPCATKPPATLPSSTGPAGASKAGHQDGGFHPLHARPAQGRGTELRPDSGSQYKMVDGAVHGDRAGT